MAAHDGGADPVSICARYSDDPTALIEILHDIQHAAGAIAEGDLHVVADRLNLSRAEVHGVMSFYSDFRREPAGRAVVQVCRGESCQAMGAAELIRTLSCALGAEPGETSADGVTLEAVYCLGNCALSPAAAINGKPLGRATPARIVSAVEAA